MKNKKLILLIVCCLLIGAGNLVSNTLTLKTGLLNKGDPDIILSDGNIIFRSEDINLFIIAVNDNNELVIMNADGQVLARWK